MTLRPDVAKFARYCSCGAAMQVRSEPPAMAEFLASEFDARHSGEGHGAATPSQAARARRRQERIEETP